MKILVIGGTRFLGRHIVLDAIARGHEVTLFNRGNNSIPEFAGVGCIKGDRDGGLGALAGRSWDCAIDTCGYVPRIAGASARALCDAVHHYAFISTISVYADAPASMIDEDANLGVIADETMETITGESYGPLKVLCERAAETAMPGRVLHVRSGLIVGPHDPTDRFTYWVRRVSRGGEILAPGSPEAPVQFIDVRDIAAWVVASSERRTVGAYNVVGPPVPMGVLLECCRRELNPRAEFRWASDEFLLAEGVQPWSQLPLWIPPEGGGYQTFGTARAVAAGLTTRPVAETIRATQEWDAPRAIAEEGMKTPISAEREAGLLAKLRGQPRPG